MKKLISLLLVIIMTCSTLVGCDWKSIFNKETSPKWEAPEGIVETTTTDKDGNSITIAHSDNFTQDDIDFVLMFRGEIRNDRVVCEPLMSYNLEMILTRGKDGDPILLAHFENPYFIIAYLKTDVSKYEHNKWGDYEFDITKYVWYKFYNSEQIVDEIDGMKRTKDSYLLYDCTIKKDIVTDIDYNKTCKYYMEYRGEYIINKMTTNMLVYFEPDLVVDVISDSKFVFYPEFGAGVLNIYIDDNNVEYLIFNYEERDEYQNQEKELFGQHYDPLVQYFEVLTEHINNSGITVKTVGIRLDILIDYLSNGR